jgi:hypothetical protein
MTGLLDFLKTPEGQGLLAAGFGGLAGAGRGGPLNTIGRAGITGLAGYGQALERQDQQAQQAKANELRDMQILKMRTGMATEDAVRAAAKSSYAPAMPGMGSLNGSLPAEMQAPTVAAKPGGFDTRGFLSQLKSIDPLKAMEWEQKLVKEPKFQVVGGALVRTDTAEPKEVYRAPEKPEATPSSIREYQFAQSQGYGGTYQQWATDQKKAGATNVMTSVNTGQKGLDNELKIRSDFRSEPIYKAHQEVQSAHSQITRSLKMASPAGDLAGATKIMKILDPGSVVRESELGMAMAATGAMDRLYNYAGSVVNGTKLTPKQRQDFQALADQLYSESAKQYNGKRGEYAGFATDYGLNADRIVGPTITSPKLPKPSAEVATAPPASGADFVFKDGKLQKAR